MLEITAGDGFSGWHTLNDTIMGGRSQGQCRVGPGGLVFEGEVIEAGGGFISCRSPVLSPPLDLSAHQGLELELSGEGRRFKLAVGCSDGMAGLSELIPGGLRWVSEFSTEAEGVTTLRLPFAQLRPSVRARPLGLPLRFQAGRVNRLQVLHSRFGDDGSANAGFRPGPIRFCLHSIRAFP
ncbi:MAG: CIA30 family protein [Cyanobacteria bacterium J06638_7]